VSRPPRVFVFPTALVPPALRERVAHPPPPTTPIPAATVVPLRPAPDGVEVLLVQRPQGSRFAAEAWVFPGGRVDPADADPAWAIHLAGPSARRWARRLRTRPAAAQAVVLAALRELLEETGWVLARDAEDRPVPTAAPPELRHAADAGAEAFRRALGARGWRLDAGRLVHLARWITPEPEARRYDTFFFAAAVPADAPVHLPPGELAAAAWWRPADAVAAWRAGELRLLPPTVHTLARLAHLRDVADLGRRRCPAPIYQPIMRPHPDGIIIEVRRASTHSRPTHEGPSGGPAP